jgi:hypothetical protein
MQDSGRSNRLPNARLGPLSGICAVSVVALLSAIPAASAAVINVVDVIPNSDSAEAFQNSEPSLAVNPLNTSQMIAGSFGNGTPFFKSVNGGTIWTDYGNLSTSDKSLAWRQDGVAALAATLQVLTPPPRFTSQIQTFSGTIAAANFGVPINTFPSPRPPKPSTSRGSGPARRVRLMRRTTI